MPVLKGRRRAWRSDYDRDETRRKIHTGVMDRHIGLLKSEKIQRKMADELEKFLNNEKKNVGVEAALHGELSTNLESAHNFLKKKIVAPAPAPVEKEPEVDPSWLTAGEYADAEWDAAKQKKNDYIFRVQQNKQRNLDAAVAAWKTITLNEQEEINELLKQASDPTELYNFKMFDQFMRKNSPLANKIKMTHGDAGKYRPGKHLRKIFNSIDADSTHTLSVGNFRNFFHLLTNGVTEGGRKLSRKRTRVRRTRSRRKVSGGKRRGRKRTRSKRKIKVGGMIGPQRSRPQRERPQRSRPARQAEWAKRAQEQEQAQALALAQPEQLSLKERLRRHKQQQQERWRRLKQQQQQQEQGEQQERQQQEQGERQLAVGDEVLERLQKKNKARVGTPEEIAKNKEKRMRIAKTGSNKRQVQRLLHGSPRRQKMEDVRNIN